MNYYTEREVVKREKQLEAIRIHFSNKYETEFTREDAITFVTRSYFHNGNSEGIRINDDNN